MTDLTTNDARLMGLIGAVFDTSASDNDFVELNSILRSDESARSCFLKYCQMHVALREELRSYHVIQKTKEKIDFELTASNSVKIGIAEEASLSTIHTPAFPLIISSPLTYLSSGWPAAYLIATVIFGIGALFGAFTYVTHPGQVARQVPVIRKDSTLTTSTFERVGRITGMVDCQWADPQSAPATNAVPLSGKYQLVSGLMEITYDTGAKVILQGPVSYEVESTNGGFLSIGKLTGKVTVKSARGFSVRTPTAVVTDLGTEFSIEAFEDQRTEVYVFQGAVDARIVSSEDDVQCYHRVTEGQAVEIGRHAKTIKASLFKRGKFVRELPPMAVTHSASGYSKAILADRPVGYWRLGDVYSIDSPNIAAMQQTMAQTATVAGSVVLGGCPGALFADPNRAATFDGSSGSISLNSTSEFGFDIGDPFTLEGWFKTTTDATIQYIIGKDDHSASVRTGYFLCLSNFPGSVGPLFQLNYGSKSAYLMCGGSLNDGKWHYVAATYNGGSPTVANMAIYVDGVKVETTGAHTSGISTLINSAPLTMGMRYRSGSGGDYPFNGSLDDLAVYNYVLSDAVIARHYQAAMQSLSAQKGDNQQGAAVKSHISDLQPARILREAEPAANDP